MNNLCLGEQNFLQSLLRWALIGLLIRLVLMPFTMHPDIVFLNYFPLLLANHGVFDIYGYISSHFGDSVKELVWSYYPPWTYFTIGFFQFLLHPFTPGFEQWISLSGGGGDVPGLPHYLMGSAGNSAFRYIAAMKVPYLFFDFLAGFFILRIVGDKCKTLAAFKFWMLNPVVLYSCFIFGAFDVLPACLIVASLYFAKKGKPVWSVVALGIGGGYKVIPLVLLPVAAAILGRSNVERIKLIIIGAIPFVLPILLLWDHSDGTVIQSVFPKVMLGKVGGGLALATQALFGVCYIGILLHILFVPFKNREEQVSRLRVYFTSILILLLISLSSPSFHYTVWVTPLLALQLVEQKALFRWVVLFVLALIPICIITKPLWGGLLAPLDPVFFLGLPSGDQILSKIIPYHYVRFGARLVFIGAGIGIAFKCLSKMVFDLKRSAEKLS